MGECASRLPGGPIWGMCFFLLSGLRFFDRLGVSVSSNLFHSLQFSSLSLQISSLSLQISSILFNYLQFSPSHLEVVVNEGNLWREFDVLDADGRNMAPNLKRKVDIIAASPLDDVVNEGPHARARRSTLGTPHHGSAEKICAVVLRELILRCRGVTPFSGGAFGARPTLLLGVVPKRNISRCWVAVGYEPGRLEPPSL